MGTRKAFFLDPYNTDIVKEIALLGRAYDSNDSNVIDFLNKAKALSREDYLKMKKESNEIDEVLYTIEDSRIKDYCHIYGEKDRKMCTITFPISGIKRKNAVSKFVNCAQHDLGIKEVFIKVDSNDKNLIKNLNDLGYESLGEDNGSIIYLKEEELEKITQRAI